MAFALSDARRFPPSLDSGIVVEASRGVPGSAARPNGIIEDAESRTQHGKCLRSHCGAPLRARDHRSRLRERRSREVRSVGRVASVFTLGVSKCLPPPPPGETIPPRLPAGRRAAAEAVSSCTEFTSRNSRRAERRLFRPFESGRDVHANSRRFASLSSCSEQRACAESLLLFNSQGGSFRL